MRRSTRSRRSPARRGSILLLTMVVTGLIALVSVSFNLGVADQMDLARDEAANLGAELASQSGAEYARRQLALDPEWPGTGGTWLRLDRDLAFRVERAAGEVSAFLPTDVRLTVEGRKEAARARHQVDLRVDPGDPLRTRAFSVLGGNIQAENVRVVGDFLWVDRTGVTWTYDADDPTADGPGEYRQVAVLSVEDLEDLANDSDADPDEDAHGTWKPGGVVRNPRIQASRVEVTGRIIKYRPIVYVNPDIEKEEQPPVFVPGWDLEPYTQPAPDRVIYAGVTSLRDIALDQTAVFVLDPGQTLTLEDVTLRGGAVVYVEDDFAPFGPPRNSVVLRGHNVIGGGAAGVDENIGLLAPGARLRVDISSGQRMFGLTYLHSVQRARRVRTRGVTIVINDLLDTADSEAIYDEATSDDPPGGIFFFGGIPDVDVRLVREAFDALPDGSGS